MSGYGATRYVPLHYYDSLADARKTLKENSITALELQTELREWLDRQASTEDYREFMKVYARQKITESQRAVLGDRLRTMTRGIVSAASTFYVSPDMCELVKMAAVDMPTSGLAPTDMPVDTGFLVFDRPVSLHAEVAEDGTFTTDGSGKTVETRIAAVAWKAATVLRSRDAFEVYPASPGIENEERVPGITYCLFTTPYDTAVTLNLSMAAIGGEPNIDPDDVRRRSGPLPIWDFSGWAYDTPWQKFSGEPECGQDTIHSIVDQTRRLVLATWRILNQTNIVVLDPHRLAKGHNVRRRATRVGIPEDGDIVIIRMRREVFTGLKKASGTNDDEPWYSIRFMVRGHWHNYWVGPKDNRRLISKYLLPYEKGPEGAPLVSKKKIFSLER